MRSRRSGALSAAKVHLHSYPRGLVRSAAQRIVLRLHPHLLPVQDLLDVEGSLSDHGLLFTVVLDDFDQSRCRFVVSVVEFQRLVLVVGEAFAIPPSPRGMRFLSDSDANVGIYA